MNDAAGFSRNIAFATVLVCCGAACGEDVVTLRTEDGGRRDAVGEIVALDARTLTLRAPTGALLDHPAADVVRVITPRLPAHLAGLRAWERRDVSDARTQFAAALGEESREWVRRDLLAALVTTDLAAADRDAAGTHFLALFRADPAAVDRLGALPVPWDDRPPRAADLAAANRWVNGSDDAERLLGAGVLVGVADRRAAAVEALKRLSRSPSPEIAELARLQRWRAQVLDGAASAAATDTARRRIDALPESLRAGPKFTLGIAHAADRREAEAIAAFLWSPLTLPSTPDGTDPVRAADGLLRAADLLKKRDPLAAVRLWRECVARFPFAGAADEARHRLDALASPATAVPASADSP